MKRACVLLSGGMDSAICLALTVASLGRDRVMTLSAAGARAPIPCGECPACLHRAAAFRELGEKDPAAR
jgi:7-cyano-7-deazaguanine synthase in queuosine biosynthesis